MGAYLVKSTLAISFAYLLYLLFMRKVSNFKWLRLYLLGISVIAFILPAVSFRLPEQQKMIVNLPEQYARCLCLSL